MPFASIAVIVACSAITVDERYCIANVYTEVPQSMAVCDTRASVQAERFGDALRRAKMRMVEVTGACFGGQDAATVVLDLPDFMTEEMGATRWKIDRFGEMK